MDNNGLTQTRTHDSQYRLTNLALAGGSTLDQLVYTYDPVGNVDYLTDQLNGSFSRDYAYDVLNWLKWDSGVSAGNPTYTYDGMGNLTNSGNNLTASIEVNGRLQTATVPNSRRVTLLYNGLGEMARARTETASGNKWTTQYWEYASFAPDGRALGLIQENTTRTEWEWVWVDHLPVVQFQDSYNSSGTYTGTTVTYLHPDQLGTPRIGTNASGAISWRYRSDAFGIATISGSHTVRLRLPGQIDLGTGGINYNYFRDYDPNIGRYLQPDTRSVGEHVELMLTRMSMPKLLRSTGITVTPYVNAPPLELNPYAYVANNPLRWTDPTGEVIEWVVPGVIVGGTCFTMYCAKQAWNYCSAAYPASAGPESDRKRMQCAAERLKFCVTFGMYIMEPIGQGAATTGEEIGTITCKECEH